MQPQMDAAEMAYVRGGGDAISTISQIDQIASQGFTYIAGKFGASAANHTRAAYIDKERERLDSEINRMASAGRDYTSRSAVQFHTGRPDQRLRRPGHQLQRRLHPRADARNRDEPNSQLDARIVPLRHELGRVRVRPRQYVPQELGEAAA